MRAVLYIPYSNGDAKNGFKYEGEISQKEYARAMVESYEQHKVGVDAAFYSNQFGHNIAANMYRKEKNKYQQQTFYYQPVESKVFDIDNFDEKIDDFIKYYKTGEKFIIIIALLNMDIADESGELESDIRAWERECVKINNTNKMDEEEKIQSLSKKSLKLKFKNSKSSAILKDCKMIEVYARNKFALLVDHIELRENDDEKMNIIENKPNNKRRIRVI